MHAKQNMSLDQIQLLNCLFRTSAIDSRKQMSEDTLFFFFFFFPFGEEGMQGLNGLLVLS